MKRLAYNLAEVEAIACLACSCAPGHGATGGAGALDLLAGLFDADFAGVALPRPGNSALSVTASVNRLGVKRTVVNPSGADRDVPLEIRNLLAVIWSRRHDAVASIAAGKCLASVDLAPGRKRSVIVLSRERGRFSAKDLQTLQIVHPIVRGALREIQADGFDNDNSMPPRVREVQQGLLDGLSEKEIGMRLGISPHTVHVYVRDLYKRRGVTSRGQLVSILVRQDLASFGASVHSAAHTSLVPVRQFQPCVQQPATKAAIPPAARATRKMIHREKQPARECVGMPSTQQIDLPAGLHANHFCRPLNQSPARSSA